MNNPVYLDYAATCPIDQRVVDKMLPFFTIDGCFGNPASKSHKYGWQAAEAVDIARNQIATFFNVTAKEIIFTSGATESNNLAIIGSANANKNKGKHIITCVTEHPSVLDSCLYLSTQGFEISYIPVKKDGLIDLDNLQKMIRSDTILVSIMFVNNEIGVIQDIPNIAKICNERNVVLHVDATQAVGKIDFNLATLPIDLVSFSAHKIYGPKGIGGLFIRKEKNLQITPILHGGRHEFGFRSGTLPTHQIVGMGEAYAICQQEMINENLRIKQLRDYLYNELSNSTNIVVNGCLQNRVFHNLNVSFIGMPKNYLISNLTDVAVSSGSACASNKNQPSHVLKALKINDDLAYNSIRFSLGRYTTKEDIDFTVYMIQNLLNKI